MPLSLPPLSRRRFLAGSVAALATSQLLHAEETVARDPHRFVLMADTHIPSAPEVSAREVNMHDNFVKASEAILALKSPPTATLLLGDCAYLDGQDADYVHLVKLLEPIRKSGMPVHLALGNHDHRERFWKALPADAGQNKYIDARHLMVIKAPRANWFILDTLDVTNKAPGALGEEQLAWLAKELDAHPDLPALIALHHNPDFKPMPGGLTDTNQLFEVLSPRKHVKACFFGHTHNWEITKKEGIHLVNLPPVAYVFSAGKPNGVVEVELAEAGAKLRLSALDPAHAEHGKMIDLAWRS